MVTHKDSGSYSYGLYARSLRQMKSDYSHTCTRQTGSTHTNQLTFVLHAYICPTHQFMSLSARSKMPTLHSLTLNKTTHRKSTTTLLDSSMGHVYAADLV